MNPVPICATTADNGETPSGAWERLNLDKTERLYYQTENPRDETRRSALKKEFQGTHEDGNPLLSHYLLRPRFEPLALFHSCFTIRILVAVLPWMLLGGQSFMLFLDVLE